MQKEMPSSGYLSSRVALRRGNVCFYAPENFRLAPTYGVIVPLAVSDILHSESVLSVYGTSAIEQYSENFFLVGNHPVQKIRVFGKIVGEQYRLSEDGKRDYILVTIDDCLGTVLSINVKVSKAIYTASGLILDNCYGVIIEVAGALTLIYDMDPRIDANYVGILGKYDDLDAEIRCWSAILHFRERVLSKPWVCSLGTKEVVEVRTFRREGRRGLEKENNEIGPANYANDEKNDPLSKSYGRSVLSGDPRNERALPQPYDRTPIILDDSSEDDIVFHTVLDQFQSDTTFSRAHLSRKPVLGGRRRALPSPNLNRSHEQHTFSDLPLDEADKDPEFHINDINCPNTTHHNPHGLIASHGPLLETSTKPVTAPSKSTPSSKHTFSLSDRFIIDFMCHNRDLCSDDSIQIIEPEHTAGVAITTENQLFLAYLFYILENGDICEFTDVRKDHRISGLLEELVRYRMSTLYISTNRGEEERIRLIYFCETELLKTKYRLVEGNRLHNMLLLAAFVRKALSETASSSTAFPVMSSLKVFAAQNQWLNSPLSIYVKIVNAICEWVLAVERNDRQQWLYNAKDKSWSIT